MAYVPDEWVMRRLDLALSAQQILFYYCARANQDTGKTNVSPEKTSQDLGIRKDHINEHDRKLVREGYINIAPDEYGGRVVRLLAPWQSRAERNGHPAQTTGKESSSQDLGKQDEAKTQILGSPLDANPKLGEVTQVLGNFTQNLGKVTQNLGAHIRNNQPMNQPMNQKEEDSAKAGANAPPTNHPPDPPNASDKTIWQLGVGLLKSAGVAESGARSFLGKMAKDFGKEKLAQAIVSTMAAAPVNPQEYLVKVLQAAGNGATGGSSYEQEKQRRARRFLDRSKTDLAVKYGHRRPER